MIKYIVYKSKTEFTKKYAELLSMKFKLPCMSLEDAKTKIPPGESIMYMAGIRAFKLYDYKKVSMKYTIDSVVAVGMSAPSEEIRKEIETNNNLEKTPFFYLRGGTAPEKLTGFDKVLFSKIAKMTEKAKKKNKTPLTEQDAQLLEAMFKGADFVDVENLKPITDWYSSYLIIQDMLAKKYKKTRH